MAKKLPGKDIKICCADFYQSDIVHTVFGDILHPRGLEMTYHSGEIIQLHEKDTVLDVASGRGVSSVSLAGHFNCRFIGMDYGIKNVISSKALAFDRGLSHMVTFIQGDAEAVPFKDCTFDAIISECSFSTFPEKTMAASEMGRVLRSGRRLCITDMTVEAQLPDDIKSLLSWVGCIAGASTAEDYVATFQKAGFIPLTIEDQCSALLHMVKSVHQKLLGLELFAKSKNFDLAGCPKSPKNEKFRP